MRVSVAALIAFSFVGLSLIQAAPIDAPKQSEVQSPKGRRGIQRRALPPGQRGRSGADTKSLVAGETAPEFQLKSVDGETETSLSTLRAEKPVVLFFGSYT